MKYICIDDGSISELISGREYQSIDFEEGDRLIQALKGRVQFLARIGKITLFQDGEGAFLTTHGNWKKKKFLVIDCEQSSLFTQLRSSETLTSFQKLLRFCTKYWSNNVLNASEKIIFGSTKAVLFPLPYSNASPFRIAIERAPLHERLKKRDMDGSFLLVYKSGHEGADSTNEVANEANIRRVVDRLADIYRTTAEAAKGSTLAGSPSAVGSTQLDSTAVLGRSIHMPFREWFPLTTTPQKRFIYSSADTPHRLFGAAGTGKTLSLILRALYLLDRAERASETFHALLVTHSEATRESIANALATIDTMGFHQRDSKQDSVALKVETLASLCADFLGRSISETEFVDRDAQDSKILQQMYIEQAIAVSKQLDYPSFKLHLSHELKRQIDSLSDADLAPLIQHEISALIKGRAGDSFEVYKRCPSLMFGLNISNDADKGYAFSVFKRYQEQLEKSNQFDTDDVVISAIGQLDTPIWRRRRIREGFDFIGIDETHLFNINELHVFHHFTRKVGNFPISFTMDESQAVGDRGWNDSASLSELFGSDNKTAPEITEYSAVFRSSPAITAFSASVLASGATLFTHFKNTLLGSQSVFTPDEERRSQPVTYREFSDDDSMVEEAFTIAENLRGETNSARYQVLITTLSDQIMEKIREHTIKTNKAVTYLERRGDFTKVKQAERSGHLVAGHVDFVGGLEFDVVLIVGVDRGRVPLEGETEDSNSRNYAAYSAHNRLYVAASRAKYALEILGVKSRGPSDLLLNAANNDLIKGVPMI
ncbi:UvrD-helicase domain-containing protein [Martelella sp. HB161492]|uniref:UvrD-helicase domain-containing protein n=1 Tax=Martelella sp. HB161492 TaxID=2720726 RepID=UPI00158FA502|nr:UvrD-helicase domain-containing protein [Martelella sp. HB161492]